MRSPPPLPPPRGPHCPPTAALEALSAGEPPAPALAAHLPTCEACRGYVEELVQARQAFLQMRPADAFLRKLERRAATQPPRRWWAGLGLGLMGAAAAMALAFLVLPRRPPGGAPDVIFKGEPFRVVARRGEAPPQAVAQDARLRAGDALRFSYDSQTAGFLFVLELDGTGKASVFHPFEGTQSAPLAAASPDFLPGSVVLDDSPGPEWLVAVFSPQPLAAAPLLEQLRAQPGASQLHLRCDGCRVSTLRFEKSP